MHHVKINLPKSRLEYMLSRANDFHWKQMKIQEYLKKIDMTPDDELLPLSEEIEDFLVAIGRNPYEAKAQQEKDVSASGQVSESDR